MTQGRRAVESPNNVGGRRAHPPRPEKDWSKKLNRKEGLLARSSALAATASEQLVSGRGHRFDEEVVLPLIVEDTFATLKHTGDVKEVLEKLGLGADLARAIKGRNNRAGRGTMRGRPFKVPRSILIVIGDEGDIIRGARNLTGVDVVPVSFLNTEMLAPGGDPGRLTVYTESAIEQLRRW